MITVDRHVIPPEKCHVTYGTYPHFRDGNGKNAEVFTIHFTRPRGKKEEPVTIRLGLTDDKLVAWVHHPNGVDTMVTRRTPPAGEARFLIPAVGHIKIDLNKARKIARKISTENFPERWKNQLMLLALREPDPKTLEIMHEHASQGNAHPSFAQFLSNVFPHIQEHSEMLNIARQIAEALRDEDLLKQLSKK